MMRIHNLKTWPEYFQAIKRGDKTFELRKDDRNFQVGDILVLHEYNPDTQEYSAAYICADVTYKLAGGQFGVEAGYCILGLKPWDKPTLDNLTAFAGAIKDAVKSHS